MLLGVPRLIQFVDVGHAGVGQVTVTGRLWLRMNP